MTANESANLQVPSQPSEICEILVLGGGAVVQQCFAPAIRGLGLQLRATVVDPQADPRRIGDGIRLVRSGFQQFLESADVTQFSHCIVALPNSLHDEAVSAALRRGLHVLCEKPLTLRRDECERLAALAEQQRRVLAVNMIRRWFRSIRIAAEAMRNGWLGDLRSVRMSHGGAYAWPVTSLAPFDPVNGGVLADMGIHYLDLAELLLGPIEPVAYSDDYEGGVESECVFRLRANRRVPVEISLSRLHRLENVIEITGSAGALRMGVDDFDHCVFESRERERILLGRSDGGVSHFEEYFEVQLRRFLEASASDNRDLADGHAAARSAALLEWAYADRGNRHRHARWGSVELERLPTGPVYVTGATGFIGSHLVSRLHGDGVSPITAAYHSLRSCAAISRYAVRYHATDLLDPSLVREAVSGSRYVFHLAYGRVPEDSRPINVQGTKNVVEAAITEGVDAVVVLSTMYVFGYPDGVVDESSAYRPYGGSYGTTKAEMERWCLERAKTSGKTRIVVLNPTCVYGPGGATYTETPARLAQQGGFCWIADGRGIANVVFVENLVDAMILAAIRPEAHGRRLIINDENLTWREFLTPMLEPWLDSIPSPSPKEFKALSAAEPSPGVGEIVRAAMFSRELYETLSRTWVANQLRRPQIKKFAPGLFARLRRRGNRVPVQTRQRAVVPGWLAEVFGPTTSRFSPAVADAVLGWKPRVSREVGMETTLAWLSRKGLR